jgi:hypothetical protein
MRSAVDGNLSGHEGIFVMSRWRITDRMAPVTKLLVPLLGHKQSTLIDSFPSR